MANKYISWDTGNDTTGDGSLSTPWKSFTKALGATGISSGDVLYAAPGTYRETVVVGMTSPTAETRIIGDVANASGFAGISPGPVILTAFVTNDKTLPVTSYLLALGGCDYLTFEDLILIGGTTGTIDATTQTSTNIGLKRCAILPTAVMATSGRLINVNGAYGVSLNWLIDRCIILHLAGGFGFHFYPATGSGSDWDLNVQIANCLFLSGAGSYPFVYLVPSGSSANKPGGIDIWNCTFIGRSTALDAHNAYCSTSIPCTFYNSIVIGANLGLDATTTGQILEDYNVLHANTPRTNVDAGTYSIADYSYALMLHVGQEWLRGACGRPFGTPMAGSPILGFGNQGGGPTVDMLGIPRPSGGASTSYGIGSLERPDCGTKETTVKRTGAAALKITGPGVHDFTFPVDAASTTITIYGRYDTNHGTTNKPQAKVLANGEIGVTEQTATMTAGVDTWEQITLGPFTPTAKGIVTVRLVSRSAAGNGLCYWDDLDITNVDARGFEHWRRSEPFEAQYQTGGGGGGFPILGGSVVR